MHHRACNSPDQHAEFAPCSNADTSGCPTVEEWLRIFFDYRFSFRWWCVAILFGFIIVFRIAAMVILKLVNHQLR